MSALKFNYDWFTPKEEDGNLSMLTRESRITEALNAIQPGDWIEFEDGVRCCSYYELSDAINRKNHEIKDHLFVEGE